MNANTYEKLDAAICAHVLSGRGHPTNSSALESVARELIESGLVGGRAPFPVAWRMIDRRMQAMRRSGQLEYVRKKGGGHGRWCVIADA